MINRIRSSIFIRYSDNFSNIINLSENKYLQIPNHLTYIHIYEIRHRRKRRRERSLRKFASPRVYTCVILLHPLVIYEWCLSTPTSSTFLWRMPYFCRWIFLDRATSLQLFSPTFFKPYLSQSFDRPPSWFYSLLVYLQWSVTKRLIHSCLVKRETIKLDFFHPPFELALKKAWDWYENK